MTFFRLSCLLLPTLASLPTYERKNKKRKGKKRDFLQFENARESVVGQGADLIHMRSPSRYVCSALCGKGRKKRETPTDSRFPHGNDDLLQIYFFFEFAK